MVQVPHRNLLFIQVLCAALMIGLALGICDYIQCLHAGACFFMTDFKVVYRPASALVYGNLPGVYNVAMAEDWLKGVNSAFFHTTLYPPYSLFLLYPLGWFIPFSAEMLWFCLHVLLLLRVVSTRAVCKIFSDFPSIYTFVFFLPFCLYALSIGQMALLCAALFLLVIIWREKHPILAGIAFSILCIKPQMAFALALLLLQERNSRALVTIVLCLGATIAASLALWGMELWVDYIKIAALSGLVLSSSLPVYNTMMSSFFIAVRMLGGSIDIANMAQLFMTCAVGVTLWRTLRRCKDDAERLMLLMPATFLLSPYVYVYDTVLLAPVCVILAARFLSGSAARIILVLLAFLPVIAVKLQAAGIPYAILAIACTYLYACRHAYSHPSPTVS